MTVPKRPGRKSLAVAAQLVGAALALAAVWLLLGNGLALLAGGLALVALGTLREAGRI